MHKPDPRWAKIPFIVAALIVASLYMAQTNSNPTRNPLLNSAMGETISGQLDRDVHESISTANESLSFRDWMTSGFTPRDVFKNAVSLEARAPKMLCSILKNLPGEKLALFEEALNDKNAPSKLPCRADLQNQITQYWNLQKTNLRNDPTSGMPVAVEVRKLPNSANDISSDDLKNGEFALVFEGGSDPSSTAQILQALQAAKTRAMFIIPGSNARNHAQLIEELAQAGQMIGSQGLHNNDLSAIPSKDAESQITEGHEAIQYMTGAKSPLFAFPLLPDSEDPSYESLKEFVQRKHMILVRANLDSEDWKTLNPKALQSKVKVQLDKSTKGIIVFHDHLEQTALALPGILNDIALQHRKLVVFTR